MSKVALCSTNAPGTFTLYRGMDKSRLKKLFDRNGNLDNIQRLISQPPTDFCGREAAYYFVADRDIAMYYAFFAKRRSDASSPVVVHAAFQNSAIESLSEVEIQRVYWPSEEWQRLIFLSRKAQRLPTDLRKFKRAALIIGTIAGKPNTCYVNMSSHVDITEEFLFKNKGENEGFGQNAVQYVFRNEEGEELLEKAEIKVYPITTTEFSEWYRNAQGRS
ncbi:hypothetical protein TrVFT333_007527 [Trichoderma virens FT-333]|nr:hypothetical protein TrVFT333_007527 [Trichoderma virens FT-333]